MAAETLHLAGLLGMGEMLREHALRTTGDRNAAYLLVHRVLIAAFRERPSGHGGYIVADLLRSIDRLAGSSPSEAARHA